MATLLSEHTGREPEHPEPAVLKRCDDPCHSSLLTSDLPDVFQGLIFVVDSNDRERVAESADELSKMVSYTAGSEPALHGDIQNLEHILTLN